MTYDYVYVWPPLIDFKVEFKPVWVINLLIRVQINLLICGDNFSLFENGFYHCILNMLDKDILKLVTLVSGEDGHQIHACNWFSFLHSLLSVSKLQASFKITVSPLAQVAWTLWGILAVHPFTTLEHSHLIASIVSE